MRKRAEEKTRKRERATARKGENEKAIPREEGIGGSEEERRREREKAGGRTESKRRRRGSEKVQSKRTRQRGIETGASTFTVFTRNPLGWTSPCTQLASHTPR